MVESSCHHAIFDDGGLALGYLPPLAAPVAACPCEGQVVGGSYDVTEDVEVWPVAALELVLDDAFQTRGLCPPHPAL